MRSEVDFGVNVPMSFAASRVVDFSPPLQMIEWGHQVPAPKELNNLYKLLYPFSVNAWILVGATCFFGCILLVLISELYSDITRVTQVSDYILHNAGMLIEPLANDVGWIKRMVSQTYGGYSAMYVWILAGFFIGNLYKSTLLAHLTSASYEKPIETFKGT